MKGRGLGAVRAVSILAVLALFAVSGMILANLGVIVYKNIAESNLENYELRTSLSYVRTKIRQADEKDCIRIEDGKRGRELVLSEKDETGGLTDTVIYFYDGGLYELTHERGAEFEPEDGFMIVAVNGFSVEKAEKGLIKLSAQDSKGKSETMYVAVRSEIDQ